MIGKGHHIVGAVRTATSAATVAAEAGAPSGPRMRAWRLHSYGAPADLRLEEARVPPLRAPTDLLVRVHCASINPIDVAMIGGYGARVLNAWRALESGEGVEFPLVGGRDFVGTVARAGAAARLRRGERVWGVVPPHRAGSHADYVVVDDGWAGPAPSALDDEGAGGAPYAALTACAALRAAGPGAAPAARALVLGLGGVGQAAVQLLAARGARVTVGCAGELRELAGRLGAAAALDRRAPEYERELEDAGPYDAILDCAGLGGWEASARRWRFARYVTLTTPLLRETDARGLAAGALCAGAALVAQGARAAATAPADGCAPHVRWAYFAPRAADLELVRRLAERGQFGVEVERVYPWWEGAAAYERAGAGHARGKLLLDFTASPQPPAPTSTRGL